MKTSLHSRICTGFLTVLLILSHCFILPAAAYQTDTASATAVLPHYAAETSVPAAQINLSETDGILTLSVQLRGTGLARTQCIALSYDTATLCLLQNDGKTALPAAALTPYDAQNYVTTSDGWLSGVMNTVSDQGVPMLEHGTAGMDRGLLLLYPTAVSPQTYASFTTVLTLRFARAAQTALNAASIRLFSAEEQTAASQTVKLMLCTETDYFTFGSRSGGDLLAAPAFIGHPVISGASENDTTDPSTSWNNPFTDISDDLLYYDAIAYVAKSGLFVGNDKNQFMPKDSMNRATFSTVLCRLAGDEAAVKAAPPTESAFTDVKTNDWFAPYVAWASEQGLFLGYGNGQFGPNDPITHEQMYLIIQRFTQSRGYAVKDGSDSSLNELADAAEISKWEGAEDGIKFAQANGLLIVDANRTIRPTEQAERWELAVLLQSLSAIPRTATATAALSDSQNTAQIPLAPPASDALVRDAIETVYNGLLTLSEKINVTSFHLNKDQIGVVYHEAAKRPELFYVDNVFHFSYNMDTGEILSVTPVYTMRGTELSSALKQYNDGLNALLSGVDKSWTDIEKILYLHDLLALHYVYDVSLGIFDTLTLMTEGRGVCQAYTLLMGALLDAVGIENERVTSEAMNHTWNLVRLNGKWYHIDVTWDDPSPDQYGQVRHTYFLKSDAYMQNNKHYGWSGFENRTCTDTAYDNAFFNEVRTPFVAGDNGLWYYISNANGSIYSWNIKTDIHTRVYAAGIRWSTASGYYVDKFTGLVRIGNLLLYNSQDSILSFNLDTKTAETVHKTTAVGSIYGLTLQWIPDSLGVKMPYLVYRVQSSPLSTTGQLYNVSAANLFTYSVAGTVKGYFADAVTKITLTRNGTTYKTLTLARTNVFLETEQTFTFDGVRPGRYDLTIEKKGCLPYTVKSIDVSANTDLTDRLSVLTLLCGDINEDSKINDTDRALLLDPNTFRRTKEQAQNAAADCNGDGIIDIVDYAILTDADRFGKDKSTCIVTHAA